MGLRACIGQRSPSVTPGVVCGALLSCALAVAVVTGGARAASSSTTVSATVPSASNLDSSGCATGAASTSFGVMLPGTSRVIAADCSLTWGSSNDTAMLRMYQADGLGAAMYRPPDGALDTSFGGTGKVTTSVDQDDDVLTSVVLQPDGKIVTGGYMYDWPGDGFTDAMVIRYNADGTLDGSFGTGGRAIDHPIANFAEDINAVALQPDGKIVASGQSSNGNIAVWRFTAAGVLDTTFSGDGRAEAVWSSNVDTGRSILVQPDGKIVVGGYVDGAVNFDFAVARFNSNGSLDTTFSGTGFQTTGLGASSDRAYAMAMQPDGKLLLAGSRHNGTNNDFAVARFTASGAFDSSFDGDGIATMSVTAGSDDATAITLQADGKIVVGGQASADFALARFNADGSLDTSFDTDGMFTTAIGTGSDSVRGVAIMPDGRIVAAGWGTNANNDFAVARYLANGAPDVSLNATGKVMTPIGTANEWANAMTIGPDGQYILVGAAWTGAYPLGYDAAVVRYASTPVADFAGGTTDWSVGSNTFGACLSSVSGSGVSGTWSANAGCATTGAWYPVPATVGSAGAKVAQATNTAVANATANLRFGFRTASSQPPGTYIAPIAFDVIAPNI